MLLNWVITTEKKFWLHRRNDPLMQYITNLNLHEVGHVLGLRHNFRGSYLYSPDEIHDKNITGMS
ncbi:MAG: hypothetical protein Ct9H90mP22_5770 [Gammaproteobacteria bacterium]|nr:MAG: hypothetical protein Ct9H90mP22_5770 [Gammaproteobacteria bacterium]